MVRITGLGAVNEVNKLVSEECLAFESERHVQVQCFKKHWCEVLAQQLFAKKK